MKLSIVIVNWNTKGLLKNCLNSIRNNLLGKLEFEIIVVDNASKDDSVEMLKNRFQHVKLIQNDKNLGFAKANNQGIKQAKGEYILLLNPDTVMVNDSILKMIDFMAMNRKVGLASCKLLNEDLTVQKSCWLFPYLWWKFLGAFGLNKVLSKVFNNKFNFNFESSAEARKIDWVKGAFMLLRGEAIRDIGGLDESSFMYGEDLDLCFHLNRIGWEIYYYPKAKIIHLDNKSGDVAWGNQRIFKVEEATYLFYKKNYTKLRYNLLLLAHFFHHLNRLLWNEVKSFKKPSSDIKRKVKERKMLLKINLSYIIKQ